MKLQKRENVFRHLAELLNSGPFFFRPDDACQNRFSWFSDVFRLDSKGGKVCKSCRSRQELSNEIAIQTSIEMQKSPSIQPRTSLSEFGDGPSEV